jgi:hypothetical protein
MKTISFTSILLIVLSLSSCVLTLPVQTKSHTQVMDEYKGKTEKEIVIVFGTPTTKKEESGVTEWTYDLGSKTVSQYAGNSIGSVQGRSGTNAAAAGVAGRNSAAVAGASRSAYSAGSSNYSSGAEVTSEIKSFIKFIFIDGKVVNWNSNGIDYGVIENKRMNLITGKEGKSIIW